MELSYSPFIQTISLFTMGKERDRFCSTILEKFHHDCSSTDPIHIVIAKDPDRKARTHRLCKDFARIINGSKRIRESKEVDRAKKVTMDLLLIHSLKPLEAEIGNDRMDPQRSGQSSSSSGVGEGTGSPDPFSGPQNHRRLRSRKRTIGLAM
jgi:hypothetical protein